MGVGQEFAHFVQENRSAISHFEAAKPTLRSSREGSLFMAKQFRGNQRGRKRGTIHTNEGTSRSLRSFVNCTGDEFFACAGFPGNQNGGVGRSDFVNSGKNGLQRTRCTENFLTHRSLVYILATGDVFLLQFLFGPLAVFNIRSSNIPTHELSL